MSESVYEIALHRSMSMLSASGAEFVAVLNGKVWTSTDLKFALQSKTGERYGNLQLVQDKPIRKKAPSVSLAHTGYSAALPNLMPGQVWSYICKDKAEGQRLQSAVTAWASKSWGHGTYLTTVKSNYEFEILRIS